ncbi:L-seryl-tRNA(Sec) kinase-like [Myxocyprinus asiaticus]|uniref:L-seryl-tRNA(Sec) kinase-like n=1 Tax=Myxocyprinus asiaticus TaxID=70543 RepID=UPI0022233761|nr:L-seryl-tRNA(Sec) kinase-like [Myxocyprinus asiaticus]
MFPARACLCVLCGLPAAGKSRLAQVLREHAQSRGWKTLLVTYDELIPASDWRESEWKQQRKTVVMCLERFLCHTHTEMTDDIWTRFEQMHTLQQTDSQTHSQPLVILLDDNFYYQSMRYEIYQLARKNSLGFCQVFLRCELHVCLQRNQQRSQRVPDEVLQQMSIRMEPPDPTRNSWEQQSLTVDNTENITDADVLKMMDMLVFALENPLRPVQDDSQQKEADRQICASSVLHQADQTCRRIISQTVTSARENQASSVVLKALAKELNELKTRFLRELKKEVLHRVSVCPEEPVNTEKLLMDAARAFERDTHEIVSKHRRL